MFNGVFEFRLFFFKQKTAYEVLRSLVGSEMCIRDRCNGLEATANVECGARAGIIEINDRLATALAIQFLSLIHI